MIDDAAGEDKEKRQRLRLRSQAAGVGVRGGRIEVAGVGHLPGAGVPKPRIPLTPWKSGELQYVTAPNLLSAPKPPSSTTSSPLPVRRGRQGRAAAQREPVAVENGAVPVREVEGLVWHIPSNV